MFKTILRKIQQNPFEKLLQKSALKKKKTFLLEWNRGLGDIPLGLYAIVHRIKKYVPDAKITFLIRSDLEEGFSFLRDVQFLVVPSWKRHAQYNIYSALQELHINPDNYDVIIEKPDPTYWVRWQIGALTPRLKWEQKYDMLWKKFNLPSSDLIAVQPAIESKYNLWRGYPPHKWQSLFNAINSPIVLLGQENTNSFSGNHLIDLRGKTNLCELLSILKNACTKAVLPDSGVLSFMYYLDVEFPIKVVSLWADIAQGIMKQNVASPNKGLKHVPLLGQDKNVNNIDVSTICFHLKE
ncbi:MAG: hypothetical protein COT84_00715 [Chlamydiae bacterium CG10_big_fil_rev_8_21_14_0_10_35_9]|nr:MAG: hypothetical protein COT84_00715 [Chlamydiae bacterium CG10_big_fil_rev_8_21_14_0_10_35_9]